MLRNPNLGSRGFHSATPAQTVEQPCLVAIAIPYADEKPFEKLYRWLDLHSIDFIQIMPGKSYKQRAKAFSAPQPGITLAKDSPEYKSLIRELLSYRP